ncbi:MAG TPA: HNH endonuclease signature motif containing protein [Chloroflexota bacterium]|nr:HNH endonuclease signature motif containing protein [Chloroflexota bacterium]
MEIDHLIPEARGGLTVEENLWLACSACNTSKGDRTTGVDPQSGGTVALFNPRFQRWRDHFAWTASGDHIVAGRRAVGPLSRRSGSTVRCWCGHGGCGCASVSILPAILQSSCYTGLKRRRRADRRQTRAKHSAAVPGCCNAYPPGPSTVEARRSFTSCEGPAHRAGCRPAGAD